jgi:hypothetical protein
MLKHYNTEIECLATLNLSNSLSLCYSKTNYVNMNQGDQIVRIFAWEIVYFRQLSKIKEVYQIFAPILFGVKFVY